MSQADSVNIGAFLASQGLLNIGQFTGLALGPGVMARAQGNNLFLDVAPGGGAGQVALTQGEWYLDAITGDDTASGLAGSPLKTFAELSRRFGVGNSLVGQPSAIVVPIQRIAVNLLTDMPTTDPLNLDAILPANTLLAISGVSTLVRAGALTAVTAKNDATNTPWDIADAVTPFTAADIGKRIRITSGPNAGQTAWIAKDLGGGVMRTSSFSAFADFAPDALILTAVTTGIVAPGDTYVLQTVSKMSVGKLNVQSGLGGGPVFLGSTFPTVGFRNVDFVNQGGLGLVPLTPNSVQLVLKGCHITGELFWGPTLLRGWLINSCIKTGAAGSSFFGACMVLGGLSLGSVGCRGIGSIFDEDFMIQGAPYFQISGEAGLSQMCVFDAPFGPGIHIGDSGPVLVTNNVSFAATCVLWGAGNGTVGISVFGGSRIANQPPAAGGSTPTITGGAGDFLLATSATGSAFDTATGLISPQTIANTWANFVLPVGGGGFGNNAHNYERDAHVLDIGYV